MRDNLPTIGCAALITVSGVQNVPAKIDTGADSSSVWVSDIVERDGALSFALFGPDSEFYTGERLVFRAGQFTRAHITNSNGRQIRYVVTLPVAIAGRHFAVRCSVADRSRLMYPVLLGRTFLKRNFVVDVGKELPRDVREQLAHAKRHRNAQQVGKE